MASNFGFNFFWRPFFRASQIERMYLADEIPSKAGKVHGLADVGINRIISLEDSMIEIMNYFRGQEKFTELWKTIPSKPTSTINTNISSSSSSSTASKPDQNNSQQ